MTTASLRLLLGALACIAAQACARFGYELVDSSESIGETPATGHCTNQMLDADETDTDCGGQDCADAAREPAASMVRIARAPPARRTSAALRPA